MATELERLEALERADPGFLSDAEKARLAELRAEAPAPAPAPIPEAKAGAVAFADIVEMDAFKRGGQQYYMPSEEGFWKSKLVESFKPEFTEKDQRWFVFETDDPKLKAQGTGVVVAELGRGAFKLKDVLDGLAIGYELVSSEVRYNLNLPLGCYADWSKDSKGLGGVRISGLRTLEAGARVEQAL